MFSLESKLRRIFSFKIKKKILPSYFLPKILKTT